ncbi:MULTISPECIES: DUF4232 domain-containing protein [unclassified Streptomyces]|uniref:DUF4232 domain-containing protein n=1 Tax=unclassified Streptomyces TaxID=2593676 RepID=UPI00093DF100|nr:DUF4232 domain-containing protein [Streptomyces sp. CB02058]OKI92650.1 hypothetical protein AMK10_23275 [Streptomyces sp. CB02058]
MRIRTEVALPAALLLALALSAPAGVATASSPAAATPAPPACRESVLTVTAKASGRPSTLRIGVTNHGRHACVVDRVPTVVFGDLDGPALPVPEGGSGAFRVPAGGSAYAAVRTLDPAATELRVVDRLTVAADPAHRGRTFGAASLGSPDGIRVWEPVTTWWHRSRAAADAALARYTG